jgi:hypothetical protein
MLILWALLRPAVARACSHIHGILAHVSPLNQLPVSLVHALYILEDVCLVLPITDRLLDLLVRCHETARHLLV